VLFDESGRAVLLHATVGQWAVGTLLVAAAVKHGIEESRGADQGARCVAVAVHRQWFSCFTLGVSTQVGSGLLFIKKCVGTFLSCGSGRQDPFGSSSSSEA
jgi:hypothetical protein